MNENENETRNQDKSYVAIQIASVQDVDLRIQGQYR
jgi:hypothetical protein